VTVDPEFDTTTGNNLQPQSAVQAGVDYVIVVDEPGHIHDSPNQSVLDGGADCTNTVAFGTNADYDFTDLLVFENIDIVDFGSDAAPGDAVDFNDTLTMTVDQSDGITATNAVETPHLVIDASEVEDDTTKTITFSADMGGGDLTYEFDGDTDDQVVELDSDSSLQNIDTLEVTDGTLDVSNIPEAQDFENIDNVVVNSGIILTAAQADGLTIEGDGRVIITEFGESDDSDFSNINVDNVTLDLQNAPSITVSGKQYEKVDEVINGEDSEVIVKDAGDEIHAWQGTLDTLTLSGYEAGTINNLAGETTLKITRNDSDFGPRSEPDGLIVLEDDVSSRSIILDQGTFVEELALNSTDLTSADITLQEAGIYRLSNANSELDNLEFTSVAGTGEHPYSGVVQANTINLADNAEVIIEGDHSFTLGGLFRGYGSLEIQGFLPTGIFLPLTEGSTIDATGLHSDENDIVSDIAFEAAAGVENLTVKGSETGFNYIIASLAEASPDVNLSVTAGEKENHLEIFGAGNSDDKAHLDIDAGSGFTGIYLEDVYATATIDGSVALYIGLIGELEAGDVDVAFLLGLQSEGSDSTISLEDVTYEQVPDQLLKLYGSGSIELASVIPGSGNTLTVKNAGDGERLISTLNASSLREALILDSAGTGDYSLDIAEIDLGVGEPGDSFDTAWDLGVFSDGNKFEWSDTLDRHADRYDYYKFTLSESATVSIDMFFSDAEGDLDLFLFDSQEGSIASSTSMDDDEHIEENLDAGDYYVRASSWDRSDDQEYDLNITTGDGAELIDPPSCSLETTGSGEVNVGVLTGKLVGTHTMEASAESTVIEDASGFTLNGNILA